MQNEYLQRPPTPGIQQRGKKELSFLSAVKADGTQINVRHKIKGIYTCSKYSYICT